MTKPFLRWVGGKFRVLDLLKPNFPLNAKRYIEPFFGSGAVGLNVDYPEYIINDNAKDLISLWQILKIHKDNFIEEVEKLFLKENNNEAKFDELKDEFNQTKDEFKKACLFIYLNRHCFNGLYRYNKKGKFNVPYGKTKNAYFPKKELIQCLDKISQFQFHNKDFREIFDLAKDGDFIYCDPPYLPISNSPNFVRYSSDGLKLQDHIDLASCARKAADNGAIVIISNHYNWYSRQIYVEMFKSKFIKINVPRITKTMNMNKNGEKADHNHDFAEEILAIF